MISFQLPLSDFQLLKGVDFSEFSEVGKILAFDEKTCTVETNDIRLFQILLDDEIISNGLTDDQEYLNPYGEKLQTLYDKIYFMLSDK